MSWNRIAYLYQLGQSGSGFKLLWGPLAMNMGVVRLHLIFTYLSLFRPTITLLYKYHQWHRIQSCSWTRVTYFLALKWDGWIRIVCCRGLLLSNIQGWFYLWGNQVTTCRAKWILATKNGKTATLEFLRYKIKDSLYYCYLSS